MGDPNIFFHFSLYPRFDHRPATDKPFLASPFCFEALEIFLWAPFLPVITWFCIVVGEKVRRVPPFSRFSCMMIIRWIVSAHSFFLFSIFALSIRLFSVKSMIAEGVLGQFPCARVKSTQDFFRCWSSEASPPLVSRPIIHPL